MVRGAARTLAMPPPLVTHRRPVTAIRVPIPVSLPPAPAKAGSASRHAPNIPLWHAPTIPLWHAPTIPLSSWSGLTRPSQADSKELLEQVIPIRILTRDQFVLPGALPALQTGFALDGERDVIMTLNEDQPVKVVAAREFRTGAKAIFLHAARDVTGHTDVQRPVRLVGQDVDKARLHPRRMTDSCLTNRKRAGEEMPIFSRSRGRTATFRTVRRPIGRIGEGFNDTSGSIVVLEQRDDRLKAGHDGVGTGTLVPVGMRALVPVSEFGQAPPGESGHGRECPALRPDCSPVSHTLSGRSPVSHI